MGSYIPNTKAERMKMLEEIGFAGFDALFSDVPDSVKLKNPLKLPEGLSEMEVIGKMRDIASANKVFKHIFRGAGAYNHYIPSIVKSVISKEEFVTAYTPYQAEISQGILQSIFEFQTMICELTGMDVANASHYDGGTAAAESLVMCTDRQRRNAYVSETVNPGVIEVMETYCFGSDTKLVKVPAKDGVTDVDALRRLISEDDEAACFYVQQPDFFGNFEDADLLADIVHEAGAKFIMGINPIAAAITKSPADCGADIAVGDGQPLGIPLSYGGPYVGFMATTSKLMRKLPGRIVGETADAKGNRAYVLTLQAREQHIRREKAGSNICSNQDLCALTASVYMAAMGSAGIAEVANQSMAKAHYLREELKKVGFTPLFDKPFFNEFVTECPIDAEELSRRLAERGILCGLPLSGDRILWCATEMNSVQDIDNLVGECSRACTFYKENEEA